MEKFYFLFIGGDPSGVSQRPRMAQPFFCVTSTGIRPFGAPNLERHAFCTWNDLRFWSTSTGIGYFGASKCPHLCDIIEVSPPRCIKILYVTPWCFSWVPFFGRLHRRFATCPKKLVTRFKIQIPCKQQNLYMAQVGPI